MSQENVDVMRLVRAISIGQRTWQAVRLRDGKVSWARFCRTEAEALEAAGLLE